MSLNLSKPLLVATVMAVGFSTACSDESNPTGPSAVSARKTVTVLPHGKMRTIDDEFTALVAVVPGFGGLYKDESGDFVVLLTNTATALSASPALATFVRRMNWVGDGEVPKFTFRAARFDFAELATSYAGIRSSLNVQGVTQTDIDDKTNQIVVGGRDDLAVKAIAASLAGLNLPPGIATARIIAPTVVTATLNDAVSPRVAGLKIDMSSGQFCSLGFNARLLNRVTGGYAPEDYFITASHCTSTSQAADGVVNGIGVGQPTLAQGIGSEYWEPPLFDNSEDLFCRSGRLCRYSDATLFRYTSGVAARMAGIANVSGGNIIGTFHVSGAITSDAVGAIVLHIGYGSGGEKGGYVTGTCVDVTQYGTIPRGGFFDTGVDMLCQSQADFDWLHGDSGGPAYAWAGGGGSAITRSRQAFSGVPRREGRMAP